MSNHQKGNQEGHELENQEGLSTRFSELNEELQSGLSELKEKISSATNELSETLSKDTMEAVNELQEGIQEEVSEVKEEVLGEVYEMKGELIGGVKETVQDFANTMFGDFQAFLSLFKFTGMWFIKPLSYNVIEMKERAKASTEDAQKYFTDVKLMKAMFIFSLLFIAIESEVQVEGEPVASEDEIISQIVFLIFYVAFVFVYVAFAWVWKMAISLKVDNTRLFIGYLIYEYATVYFLQFISVAVLRLDFSEDTMGMMLALFIPFTHMLYFFYRLMKHYEVIGKRKWVGLAAAAVFAFIFLIITAAMSHVAVLEGI